MLAPDLRDLHDEHHERHLRPGFFRLRVVKDGPYVPAVIYRPCPIEMPANGPWQAVDRFYPLRAYYGITLLGNLDKPVPPFRIWERGEEVTYNEYKDWCATRQHIERYEPDAIDANPLKAVDITHMAPRGPRKK